LGGENKQRRIEVPFFLRKNGVEIFAPVYTHRKQL